jgi:hypothetical protein
MCAALADARAQVVALLKETQVVGRQAASKELQYLHDINTVFVRQLCASAESSGCSPRHKSSFAEPPPSSCM